MEKPERQPESSDELRRLNAVRTACVLGIGFGYASTMRVGPQAAEWGAHLGHDPSWYGLQVLFFLSGWLGWRSLSHGRTGLTYLRSRAERIWPWLALYTGLTVALVYPLLCEPGGWSADRFAMIGRYLLSTLTLTNPGGPMPGALDNAPYACVLQGTIWTLRWGLLLHVGLVVLHKLGLRDVSMLARLLGLALFTYLSAYLLVLRGADWIAPIGPGLRFGYAFVLGAMVFALGDRLPRTGRGWLIVSLGFFAAAVVLWTLLPTLPATEILATCGWCALAMAGLFGRRKLLTDWSPIHLPFYLGIWPVTQLVFAALPSVSVASLIAISLGAALALAGTILMIRRLLAGRGLHGRIQTA